MSPPDPPHPSDPHPEPLTPEPAAAEGDTPAGGDRNIGMVRDSVETFAAQIINIAVALIASVLLGRALAPTGKGLLAILILIPKSAWTFGTLGLDQVNTVYAGREPERRHELATTTLFIGLVVSLVATIAVALLIYWPGKGAARAGLHPGDFILAIEGQPISALEERRLPFDLSAHPTRVAVTAWRQGTTFEASIPVESRRNGHTIALENFALSPLNKWRYGLTVTPLYAQEVEYPELEFAAIPLTEAHWRDLAERDAEGLIEAGLTLPDPQNALLVTRAGKGGRLARLLSLGRKRLPLNPGDFIVGINGRALPTPDGQTPELPVFLEDGVFALDVVRGGHVLQFRKPLDLPPAQVEFATETKPLGAMPVALRRLGLLKQLRWRQQIYLPNLGLAAVPMTPERWQDLTERQALGAFAEDTTIPAAGPALLVTEVDYPFLRKWSEDLPQNLFFLVMLFFPLTVTAYLMDSILYGLNLIRLKNQKTIWTTIALAVLYGIILYGYGVRYLGLTPRSAEDLITLLWLTAYVTLAHGLFILIYSYFLIRTRANFGRKYLNFRYIRDCFNVIGWRSYIANTASYLFYDIDVLIIKHIIDLGTTTMTLENLGNYTQATNIIERVWIVPGAIATALLPKLTNFGVAKAGELTPKSVRHTLVLTLAILIPLALLLPAAIPILWGPEFSPLMGPFYFLMPGILLFSMSKVFSSHLLGIAKPEYAMRYSVFTVIVNVVLNFVFIPLKTTVLGVPLGGINGAALASTIAYTMHALLMMLAYVKESGVPVAAIFRFTSDDWGLYLRAWQGSRATLTRFLAPRSRRGSAGVR